MDWKQFFRPIKWKIIITILSLVLIYFLPIVPCYTGLTNGIVRETGVWKFCSLGLLRSGNFYDYFGLNIDYQFGGFLSYIYLIIISYLVSCIIIFNINKSKE
jgi:hypothetical protein